VLAVVVVHAHPGEVGAVVVVLELGSATAVCCLSDAMPEEASPVAVLLLANVLLF
jgi:hypothetical protein